MRTEAGNPGRLGVTGRARASIGMARARSLDGLRGIAVVLVILGHLSAYVWPLEGTLRSTPLVRGLIGGGAVPIFFIVGGYVVTTSLLRDRSEDSLDPVRFLARRVVRLGVHLVPLAAVVIGIAMVDPTDRNPMASTVNTVTNMLTYTLNWLYALNPLGARADLGHLWFLSVQQQWYLVLPLLVIALSPRRLGAVLVLLAAAAATYRCLALTDANWFALSVDTLARADGLLLGAALATPALATRRLSRWAPWTGTVALLAVIGLLAISPELGPFAFLRGWSIAFVLVAGLLVASLAAHERPSWLTAVLSTPPLAWLGRNSLALYLWHFPLIFYVGRHWPDLDWASQTAVVLVVLAVVAVVSQRWIDGPTRAFLSTHLQPPGRRTKQPEMAR